jgi:alkylated DNA repair dioxygenase AlkB
MSKRTLDAFFKPPPKRTKPDTNDDLENTTPQSPDTHPTYPHPISKLPAHLEKAIQETGTASKPNPETKDQLKGKPMNNQPDLDCIYFQPFLPRRTADEIFRILRAELPFYRVVYFAKRGGTDVEIKTPRFTTVFGVDEGCFFEDINKLDTPAETPGNTTISNMKVGENQEYKTSPLTLRKKSTVTNPSTTIPNYTRPPRPIPTLLHTLKTAVETATNQSYNFVLVNYYASGEDSIAFHSDDERFLGFEPAIASLSLGAQREFCLKHKPSPSPSPSGKPGGSGSGGVIKLALGSGDMVLMRGSTQANWLHGVPKRTGRGGVGPGGRINVTFRRAVVPAGTDNYYHYNVGDRGVWRWDEIRREMVEVKGERERDLKGKLEGEV